MSFEELEKYKIQKHYKEWKEQLEKFSKEELVERTATLLSRL